MFMARQELQDMKAITTALIGTGLVSATQAAPGHEKGELDCHSVGEMKTDATEDSSATHHYGALNYDLKKIKIRGKGGKGTPKKKA